ncbi:methyltransferase family protein [Marinigracilibium pacificum]|uniref:Isoprenylcysteine carboxylmethyltransferase family protein n=1 Tax=Marinigracilibium pacificum TaxID=2729599 RepID=A0A848IXR1_9BACT|nr:isoprenylcysteine carboxylmethyltransferase family protein [Marinigracilibium pacificum]NMM47034.1 isoprenylcysteine carboxylmethyltransferase family protein [Marinigracilibium pacificum]
MVLILFLCNWLVFYFIHSFLADTQIKEKTRKLTGISQRQYRLFYFLFSGLHFTALLVFYYIIPKVPIFILPGRIIISIALAIFGAAIIVYSFKYISAKEFMGLDESLNQELVTKGIYNYVRHPLYSGTILILVGWLYFSLNIYSVTLFLITLFYLVVGIKLEERKLISLFGDSYVSYKKRVGSLFPKIKKAG